MLLAIILVLIVWNSLKTGNIERNGLETNATIVDINHQKFVLNQQEGTSVNTYFFQYKFEYQGQTYEGIHEISSDQIPKYFPGIPTKGSSIIIQFLQSNPNKNQIKKADNKR